MPKTHYYSPNNNFLAKPTKLEGQFTVFNVRTNLKVAVLDADGYGFKFCDPDSYITCNQLKELITLAEELQKLFA